MITIILPYPPSANRVWRTYMPKGFKSPVTVLSAEGKAFKQQVGWLVKAAGLLKPIKGRVQVDVKLYPNRPKDWQKRMKKDGAAWDDTVQCLDLDNVNKALMDALKGVAIEDDKWVRKIIAERMEPDGEARLVVTISQHGLEIKET